MLHIHNLYNHVAILMGHITVFSCVKIGVVYLTAFSVIDERDTRTYILYNG